MLLADLSSPRNIELDPDCVVVIGAGAVGIHLAVQLVQRGRQVLVLESGSRELEGFSPDTFEVAGRKHDGIQIGRSVALGGTSNLWGGQLVEFNPIDMNGRDWLAGSRWPVSFSELASYYPSTYEALGIDPIAQQDDAVWEEIGKPRPELGHETEVFLTRWMKIPNIAAHFGREVESNPKLLVVLNATVVGFEGHADRITGVSVLDNSGSQHILRGHDFVLSAGTIENVRLLLHTAEDRSWECPWRGNDNIGRFFQDHLGGRLAYIKPRNAKAFYEVFCTIVARGHKFQPKIRLCNDLLEREPLLSSQAWIAFESSIKENLIFLKQFFKAAAFSRQIGSLGELVRNAIACSRYMIPLMWKFIVEHRILIPSGSRISLTIQSEVQPMRESRITIDPSVRDHAGLSKVVLDWQLSGCEIDHILNFTRRVEQAFQDAGLADLDIDPALAAADPKFLENLHDTNHHAGGCVMGESEKDGVVDRNLRVFGTENLYAAGACVFRTCSDANVTFTAMTFATRLADHLAGPSKHGTG
jgi:choline dehydrogenase-like flavoprotein